MQPSHTGEQMPGTAIGSILAHLVSIINYSPSVAAVTYWKTTAKDSWRIGSSSHGLRYRLLTFRGSCHILEDSCQGQLEDLFPLARSLVAPTGGYRQNFPHHKQNSRPSTQKLL